MSIDSKLLFAVIFLDAKELVIPLDSEGPNNIIIEKIIIINDNGTFNEINGDSNVVNGERNDKAPQGNAQSNGASTAAPAKVDSTEVCRKALTALFAEGVVKEYKQWYAIYRVLASRGLMPEEMPLFCQGIEALGLDLSPCCMYENWRKVGNELPHLPANPSQWLGLEHIASEKERRMIDVAAKLLEIIEGL